jgi:hypothetical protein
MLLQTNPFLIISHTAPIKQIILRINKAPLPYNVLNHLPLYNSGTDKGNACVNASVNPII